MHACFCCIWFSFVLRCDSCLLLLYVNLPINQPNYSSCHLQILLQMSTNVDTLLSTFTNNANNVYAIFMDCFCVFFNLICIIISVLFYCFYSRLRLIELPIFVGWGIKP